MSSALANTDRPDSAAPLDDRPLTACIVDDEDLARRGIRKRLAEMDRVTVVAECSSGREAVDTISSVQPDLVFLDVQMPGLDGFDVVEAIGADAMPVVIFVTAYDRHALRAFQVHALDYLLKPIDPDRFEEAVARARAHVEQQATSTLGDRLSDVLRAVAADALHPDDENEGADDGPVDHFVVKSAGRIQVVRTPTIRWVEAAGDYVRLHTGADRPPLLRETMTAMERKLGPSFLRIHRSTIVNTDCLRELRPCGNGDYVVFLDNDTRLKLSRSYRDAVADFFDGAI